MLFQYRRYRYAVSAGDFSSNSVILTYRSSEPLNQLGANLNLYSVIFSWGTLMRQAKAILRSSILAAIFTYSSLYAEVLDSAANGFTVKNTVLIEADRGVVYQAAMANVGSWWSSDHTVSGNAANLYMDARVLGCFCERLGDGAGLVHLSISFINPGVLVRFNGGLGPLGLMGVAGNMTWEFETVDEGTLVTIEYAIGGYMPGGLDSIAAPVDDVLFDALARLAAYVQDAEPS